MGLLTSRIAFQPPRRDRYDIRGDYLRLETSPGEQIAAFYIEGPPGSQLTILFSHGNSEDIGPVLYRYMSQLASNLCVNVLAYDYTGYGRSTGRPSEAACYADIRAAWRYLTERKQTPPRNIILYGRSLGSGPTIDLATEQSKVGGIILQSPFLSCVRVALQRRRVPIDDVKTQAQLSEEELTNNQNGINDNNNISNNNNNNNSDSDSDDSDDSNDEFHITNKNNNNSNLSLRHSASEPAVDVLVHPSRASSSIFEKGNGGSHSSLPRTGSGSSLRTSLNDNSPANQHYRLPGDMFDNVSKLHLLNRSIPIFVIHGTADRIVPYRHGKLLVDECNRCRLNVTFMSLEDAGHNDIRAKYQSLVFRKIQEIVLAPALERVQATQPGRRSPFVSRQIPKVSRRRSRYLIYDQDADLSSDEGVHEEEEEDALKQLREEIDAPYNS